MPHQQAACQMRCWTGLCLDSQRPDTWFSFVEFHVFRGVRKFPEKRIATEEAANEIKPVLKFHAEVSGN